ncbi:MAG: DEAD/DEAH box helicase family protein [Lachnospiraceae bacterium]|nr:DEAD/DEAH box helicase family protein [Lachnospiraceae bacterium]
MNERYLKPFQFELVKYIEHELIDKNSKKILVSMPVGAGTFSVVFAVCEVLIQKNKDSRFLFLVKHSHLEKQLLNRIEEQFGAETLEKSIMNVLSYGQLQDTEKENCFSVDYVVCIDISGATNIPLSKFNENVAFIGITSQAVSIKHGLFEGIPFSYCYTKGHAVYDGVITSPEASDMYDKATEGFARRLLQYYDVLPVKNTGTRSDVISRNMDYFVDIGGQQILVECKSYREQKVSIAYLKKIIDRVTEKNRQNTKKSRIIIAFTELDDEEVKQIYDEYNVVIWDISNLIYLTRNNSMLRAELGTLTQFSINNIAGKEPYGWYPQKDEDSLHMQKLPTKAKALELISRLKQCETGKECSGDYEEICSDIIKYLFMDQFNKIKIQSQTKDGMFRMDMVCALKETGSFWGLIRHYYNSHFIVFEFKNSREKLSQDMIYSTEKYLFNTTLRNVSIIISRNGFSSNATKAAEGCLKENGKLILDITDEDLINMILKKERGEEPADYLMSAFEDLMLSIGK